MRPTASIPMKALGIGFTLLFCLGPGVDVGEAQQIRIEGFFPRLSGLDANGRGIRYTSIYVNAPDVAKPGGRGGAPPAPVGAGRPGQ